MRKRMAVIFIVSIILMSFTSCGSANKPGENSRAILASGRANSSATVIWEFHSDGEMVFTGAGNYEYSNHDDFEEWITTIVFQNGVIKIKKTETTYAASGFSGCNNLKAVYLPNSVQDISSYIFNDCPALTDIYYEGTKEQWGSIEIGENNDSLLNAEVHYSAW